MFRDRKDAGARLATALEKYRGQDVVVLAIARGGVEVAAVVAHHIGAELGLLIARKLGHPNNPEAAFGAIAEDGSIYYNRFARSDIPVDTIRAVIDNERREIKRRIRLYREGRSLPVIRNRTVIIIDDGIATGATLYAAIMLCRKQRAKRIVVAVPVAPASIVREMRLGVDEMIVLEEPLHFYSVSQGYHEFFDLTDEEVVHLLHESMAL